jgi:large subunit ribosomal protein L2
MVKKHKPTSPGRRKFVLPDMSEITKKNEPLKKLVLKKRKTNGRNNHGHITIRHRGGGHKRMYRLIDFKRRKLDIEAKVASIEYDPNRTAHIALLHYKDGEKRYILAPKGLKVGTLVMSGESAPFKPGNAMKIKAMPLGSTIHNIEMHPGRGGVLVRSAGLSAQLMAKSEGYVTIKMPSGQVRMVHEECFATFGALSNSENNLKVDGKAGRRRWRGFRPTVRGTAMNSVDHVMGGGEGRQNSYHPRTPWGVATKGHRTRSPKKKNTLIVKDRRKK